VTICIHDIVNVRHLFASRVRPPQSCCAPPPAFIRPRSPGAADGARSRRAAEHAGGRLATNLAFAAHTTLRPRGRGRAWLSVCSHGSASEQHRLGLGSLGLRPGSRLHLRIIHARGRLCMQEDWRFLLHGGAAAADRSIQDRSIPPVMSDGSSRGVAGFLTPSYPRLRAERGPPWTSRSGESQPHGSCSRLAACSSSFGSLRRLALPVAGPPSRSKSTRTPIIWDRRRASGTSSRLPAGAWLAPRCLPAAAAPPAAVRKLWGSCAVVLPDLLRRFASSSVQGWTKVRHPPPARLPIAATDGRRVEANL
jgi:hypothetical protein